MLSPGTGQGACKFGVTKDPRDRVDQPALIVGSHHQARLAVDNGRAHAANIGPDDRDSGRLRLDQAHRRPLIV